MAPLPVPGRPATANVFDGEMAPDLFNAVDAGKTLKINSLLLLARCADAGAYKIDLTAANSDGTTVTGKLAPVAAYGGLHFAARATAGVEVSATEPLATWQFRMTRPGGGALRLARGTATMEVQDVYLLVGYQWE